MKLGHMQRHLIPFCKLLVTILTLVHKSVWKVHDFNVAQQISFLLTLFVAYSALEHVDVFVKDRVLSHYFVRGGHGQSCNENIQNEM